VGRKKEIEKAQAHYPCCGDDNGKHAAKGAEENSPKQDYQDEKMQGKGPQRPFFEQVCEGGCRDFHSADEDAIGLGKNGIKAVLSIREQYFR